MTLSVGDFVDMNGYYPVYSDVGYAHGQFGSLSPSTTANGFTILYLFLYTNYSTGQTVWVLEVSGFGSNPGAAWLQSISIPTVGTLTGASASFTYGSGVSEWEWTNSTSPGNGTVTIVHE